MILLITRAEYDVLLEHFLFKLHDCFIYITGLFADFFNFFEVLKVRFVDFSSKGKEDRSGGN